MQILAQHNIIDEKRYNVIRDCELSQISLVAKWHIWVEPYQSENTNFFCGVLMLGMSTLILASMPDWHF